MIKHAKDKVTGDRSDEYKPRFKVTVPYRDNAFTCDVFDSSKELIDLDKVDAKGAKVAAIIQCTGVWFAGGKFGVSWKVVQMKVMPNKTKLVGYALVDVDDDHAASSTVVEAEEDAMRFC